VKKVFAQENQALAGYEGISSWHFRDQGVLIKELEQWSTGVLRFRIGECWLKNRIQESKDRRKWTSNIQHSTSNIERRMTPYL